MTKKELERENAQLREALERIRKIADDPQAYIKEKFPDWSDESGYAAGIGTILAISNFALTGKFD
jgi:hypothetical protein